MKPRSFATAYVGGGTPSSLPHELLERLLAAVREKLEDSYEWTFEGNPEDFDEELCLLLGKAGINRVSMGMQSARPLALSFLGRRHGFETVGRAASSLRAAGIKNISLDLIYGLPGETLDEVRYDIGRLLSLNPTHFSTYSLEIHEGTPLARKGIREASDDILAEHLSLIEEEGRKRGYARYEISSFALPGYQARHNIAYWKDDEYVGIGMGAAGYEDGIRYVNPGLLIPYLQKAPRSEEAVDSRSGKEYFLLTNLRLAEGFALKDYAAKCGSSFLADFGASFKELSAEGLLACDGTNVKPTEQGMNLLDRVLLRLYNDLR